MSLVTDVRSVLTCLDVGMNRGDKSEEYACDFWGLEYRVYCGEEGG